MFEEERHDQGHQCCSTLWCLATAPLQRAITARHSSAQSRVGRLRARPQNTCTAAVHKGKQLALFFCEQRHKQKGGGRRPCSLRRRRPPAERNDEPNFGLSFLSAEGPKFALSFLSLFLRSLLT